MVEREERKFWTYAPGDKVYVIDRWYDDGPTSHVAIEKEEIKEVCIQAGEDKVSSVKYYFDGWLEGVDEHDVDADFDVLVNQMKKEWEQKKS